MALSSIQRLPYPAVCLGEWTKASVALPNNPTTPDWMQCDVFACKVLEEASREISANCRSLGDALQSVCHHALQQLPAEDGSAVSAVAGTEFISTFAHFSSALLAVAGDLEIIVSQPLQRQIATLVEECTGRAKHLQQVKKRFSELQEKYGKAQQKTMEAKSKLASGGDKPADQHAAVCDLARCEEELLASEASLRKLEDESRERLAQLDMDKKATLQRVLQQGRCSLRRLLRVADEVPPMEDFQGVMPAADYSACLKEVEPESGAGEALDLPDDVRESNVPEMERKDSLTDRFAKYLPGPAPDLEDGEFEVDVEVGLPPGTGWVHGRDHWFLKAMPKFSSSKLLGQDLVQKKTSEKAGTALNEQDPIKQGPLSESSSEEDSLARPAEIELELSPLVSEHPQQSFEAYVKRVPELLAAAVETNWDKLQACAAEHPLGSLLFWIHERGDVQTKLVESAVGLVCFQFVQGHASHYARILHLSVAKPEALQSAVSQARRLILETLPVRSLRVTVLAAEDGAQRICIDPHVELAYHQCGFRWFQLTQKLRRKKTALLRHRKKCAVRFLVLHSQRTDADPPAPRSEIGTKAPVLLQSQTSDEGAKESPGASAEPDNDTGKDELTFSAW
eukprot:symbB.v1.2.021734.t1/scaffold1896.1/size96813/5